jgi:hypothetical protein
MTTFMAWAAASMLLCPGLSAQDENQLRKFVSQEGRFSVLIPGTPQTDSQSVALSGGSQSTTLYQYWVELENDNVSYMVMYNDYPPGFVKDTPQTALTRTRDGAVKGKTLLTDREINLNGVPGREFTAAGPDGYSYEVRQYLKDQRLYQLIVVTNKNFEAKVRTAFMNSFEIRN